MSLPFQYTDVRSYDNSDSYEHTNEQLPRLRELTEKVNPKIAGAIASGGEVPLGVMLIQPDIEQCVAIDQAYGSIKWAYRKAMIIHLCTPDEAHKLLTSKATSWSPSDDPNFPPDLKATLELATPTSLKAPFRAAGPDLWARYLTVTDIAKIKSNLSKLHLVHGDIRDLDQFSSKRYDIVYLSNATNKSNYDANTLTLDHFNEILRNQGYVLSTACEKVSDNWITDVSLDSLRDHTGNSWTYNLLRYRKHQSWTGQRLAWQRMGGILADRAHPQPRTIQAHCLSCGVTRGFNQSTRRSDGVRACDWCGHSMKIPIVAHGTITRLYERYQKG